MVPTTDVGSGTFWDSLRGSVVEDCWKALVFLDVVREVFWVAFLLYGAFLKMGVVRGRVGPDLGI